MEPMAKMKCTICGHVYDQKKGAPGIEPGTYFEDLQDDWICPICGAVKTKFKEVV